MLTRPVVTALVLCVGLCFAAPTKTTAKKPTAKAKVATQRVATRNAATKAKTNTRAKYAAKSKTRSSWKQVRYTRRPSAPAVPSSERIRLVQEALISRGYLEGSPTGIWDAASVAALKKLETEQNVRADGRLDSKMLILLGLGPKYQSDLALPGDAIASSSSVSADESRNDGMPRINE